MAKLKIRTRAFVHKGGELVDVDTLSPEDRQEVGTQIALGWFNALYAGKAEFRRTSDIDPNDGRVWEPVQVGLFPKKGDTKDDETISLPPVRGGEFRGDNGRGL